MPEITLDDIKEVEIWSVDYKGPVETATTDLEEYMAVSKKEFVEIRNPQRCMRYIANPNRDCVIKFVSKSNTKGLKPQRWYIMDKDTNFYERVTYADMGMSVASGFKMVRKGIKSYAFAKVEISGEVIDELGEKL